MSFVLKYAWVFATDVYIMKSMEIGCKIGIFLNKTTMRDDPQPRFDPQYL